MTPLAQWVAAVDWRAAAIVAGFAVAHLTFAWRVWRDGVGGAVDVG
jgi:hypothetical protein